MRNPQAEIERRAAEALRRGALLYPLPGAAAAGEASAGAVASDGGAVISAAGATSEVQQPSTAAAEAVRGGDGTIAAASSWLPAESEAPAKANGAQMEPALMSAGLVKGLEFIEPVLSTAEPDTAMAPAEQPAKVRKERKEKKHHRDRVEPAGALSCKGGELWPDTTFSEAPALGAVYAGAPHKIKLKLRTRAAAEP